MLPILTRSLVWASLGVTAAVIERSALPLVIASLVVLLKHGVTVGMLVVGAYVDALAGRAGSIGAGELTGTRAVLTGT